jgi:hypothetical protein
MSSGRGNNTLGPRLTVGVRDEQMDVLDDRGCNGC